MLVAYLLFSVVDTTSKSLLGLGYLAMQLAFFRYASQLVITTAILAVRGTKVLQEARPLLPQLVLRGSLLILSTIFNFIALKTMSLTVTSAIMFSAPVIVCALSWPILGERVGIVRWCAVAIGFLGVLIVIRPFGADLNPAAFLMVLAATGLALYSIMTRKLAGDVPALALQFVLGLTGTLVLAPFALVFWVAPETLLHLILMASLGLFAWIGHEFLIRAHQVAEANFLMPYSYSYLIYMSISGYVFFDELPDGWTIIGACLIAASGLLIWWRELQMTRVRESAS